MHLRCITPGACCSLTPTNIPLSSLSCSTPQCRELVATDRLSCVRAFTRLFDALATPENGVTAEEGE